MNRQDLYHSAGCLELALSYHAMVFTNRKKQKQNKATHYITCRTYRHFDVKNFQDEINTIVWSDLYELDYINVSATYFCLMLLEKIDLHAPLRKLKIRDFAPKWLTADYLAHVDEREYWCMKFRKKPCEAFLRTN